MKIKPISNTKVLDAIDVREIDIIADDGRVLFTIYEKSDGGLEISSGGCVKHNDVMLDSEIEISLKAANVFTVKRKVYK
jgi:hypothetical protein